jgi:uncharacterized protein
LFDQTSIWQWLIGLVCGVIAGASKTGVPGIGVIVAVLMVSIFPGREGVGATIPILLFGDLIAVRWYSKHARWDKLKVLMPWVAIGMLLGAVVLFGLGESPSAKSAVNITIGVLVLALVGLFVYRMRVGEIKPPGSQLAHGATGIAAGISTTVSNAAGPLMNIYTASLGLDKLAFMGTTAWYFLIFNTAKIPLYLLLDWLTPNQPLFTARGLGFAALMLPAVLVGVFAGRWLLRSFSQRVFNYATIVGATVGALRLIWVSL